MNLNKFLSELKRRNVYKVALTYAITSWLLAQIVALASDTFGAPDWVTKIVFVILVIGFPIALILAWAFELSPQGMIRTNSSAAEENPYPSSKKKPFTSNLLIGVLALIIIGQFAYNKYGSDEPAIDDGLDNSIAVLPFDDLSSKGDTEWFCDGMTEDILTRLSKIKELKVISRSSVMQYKENRPSVPEIAKALGVSYILEGSVRKHEDKIVITAQLIDANDRHLWADNFNDSFKEVFDIQKKVSLKIVQQLEIAIDPYENSQIEKIPTKNMQAYELLLKARSFSDRGTKEDYRRGVELYREAIELDPEFLEAYIELAWSHIFNGYLDQDNWDETMKEMKNLIKKASEINPESGYVYFSNGLLNWFYDVNQEEATLNFEKGLELIPNNAYANNFIAMYYTYGENKDLKKAMFHINRAAELDPFSAIISESKIAVLLEDERIVEAEVFFKDKNTLFSESNKNFLNSEILYGKAKKLVKERKDWTQAIYFYEIEIEKDSKNALLYRRLGELYDVVLNDDENYIKYTKIAYELDSTESNLSSEYATALIEGKRFDEAQKLMNSKNYKSSHSSSNEMAKLVYYHYHKEEYDLALEILEDSLLENFYEEYKVLALAQNGNVDEATKLLNNKGLISDWNKALVFAVLKNRDSMYYYMDISERKTSVNSRREVDPYRKEQRYIEFLEKNYIPITHWNK